MVILFILLFIPCVLAVLGKYNAAKIAFWIFLVALIGIFIHHVTSSINIQL